MATKIHDLRSSKILPKRRHLQIFYQCLVVARIGRGSLLNMFEFWTKRTIRFTNDASRKTIVSAHPTWRSTCCQHLTKLTSTNMAPAPPITSERNGLAAAKEYDGESDMYTPSIDSLEMKDANAGGHASEDILPGKRLIEWQSASRNVQCDTQWPLSFATLRSPCAASRVVPSCLLCLLVTDPACMVIDADMSPSLSPKTN
jgi:hypothetical protein